MCLNQLCHQDSNWNGPVILKDFLMLIDGDQYAFVGLELKGFPSGPHDGDLQASFQETVVNRHLF